MNLIPKNKKEWMIAALAIIFIGILFLVKVKIFNYLEIDACLDAGGRYDYEKKICENVMNYIPLNERFSFKVLSIFVDLVIFVSGLIFFRESCRFNWLYLRKPQINDWISRFSQNEKEILVFLQILSDSFMISEKGKLNISPDDNLEIFYHESRINRSIDSMEIEVFLNEIEDKFRVEFDPKDVEGRKSFGEIFEMILMKIKKEA